MKNKLFFVMLFLFSAFLCSGEDSLSFTGKGDYYFTAGDYYRAVENYKSALEINPAYSEALKGLAESYYYLEEYEEALKHILTAKKYDKNNIELDVIEGHIRIGLGDVAESRKIFTAIEKREPNNIGAYFGFAEIALVSGHFKDSAGRYMDILSVQPGNKKALLSMIVILDYQRRYDEAQKFVDDAVRFFGSDPSALYIAGKHYFLTGNIDEAEKYISVSLSYDDSSVEASLLYSNILFSKGEYSKVPQVLNKFYKMENNSEVAYTLGLAAEKSKELKQAVRYFSRSLQISPGDEISRFAMENCIRSSTPFSDSLRKQAGNYHFKLAKGLNDRNYLEQSILRYKRGLAIDPYSDEGRLAYGRLLLKKGYRGKYLSELQILPDEVKNRRRIKDDIEIQTSLLEKSTAAKWDVNQFLIDKNNFKFNIFYYPDSFNMRHPDGEKVICEVFYDILGHYENISLPEQIEKISSFSDAFELSRSSSDYFIVTECSEDNRFFRFQCSVYSSLTGSLIKEYSIIKTGNYKIWDSLNKTAELLESDIMICGNMIKLDFENALINLGRMDGIANNDLFMIFPKDKVQVSRTYMGYRYSDSDVLGIFEVTGADEYVSDGTVKSKDLFDMVNHNDIVIKITPEKAADISASSDRSTGTFRSDLFKMINKIR